MLQCYHDYSFHVAGTGHDAAEHLPVWTLSRLKDCRHSLHEDHHIHALTDRSYRYRFDHRVEIA